MKKIPSIFERDWEGNRNRVLDKPTEAWELANDALARATTKWDGTAVLVRDGILYKRYDCKKGRTPPENFEPCQEPDENGHWPGWVPVSDRPEDKWYREPEVPSGNGTYELVGPKIQSNPHQLNEHRFVRHGAEYWPGMPIDYETLKKFFRDTTIEGLVWWIDGEPVAKIKRGDFGFPWPPEEREESDA